MTAASVATGHCKKAVKFGLSLFGRSFNSSKCKTMTKMAVARIKLLRNKRDAVVKQMRRDIALLLQSSQDATARIRVEHVIREQNIMAANEILVLFCDLIVARLNIISKQRECPPDLKEGIASLIFAAPRSSDIPELLAIRDIFQKKYGKDFVSAATDLRPDAGVNRLLIEKLSVRTPSGQVKLNVMKEIAKEYQLDWDTTESEQELLKPPEERIEGPRTFVSASSLPVKPVQRRFSEPPKPTPRDLDKEEVNVVRYEDPASAAEAAAMSAKKAIEAAEAAAYMANNDPHQIPKAYTSTNSMNNHSFGHEFRSQSIGGSHYTSNENEISPKTNGERGVNRRHSYNMPPVNSGIKFDESDCDEEIEMEELNDDGMGAYPPPPNHPAPQVPGSRDKLGPRVHPKLPDYDALTARFDALKLPKARK